MKSSLLILIALLLAGCASTLVAQPHPHEHRPATKADLKQLADWTRDQLEQQNARLSRQDKNISHVHESQQRSRADVEHKLGGLRQAFDGLTAERNRAPAADFAGVQAVVLIPELLDGTQGELAEIAAPGVYRIIHRKLDEAAGGKARITLLSERSEPRKFQAYCERLGTRNDQVSITLFLPHHVDGIVKGLIVKKVEQRVIAQTAGTRLYVLPERVHPDAYHDALEILDRDFEGEQPPEEWNLLHAVLGLLSLLLGERAAGWIAYVRGRKQLLFQEQTNKSDEKAPA